MALNWERSLPGHKGADDIGVFMARLMPHGWGEGLHRAENGPATSAPGTPQRGNQTG